MVYQDIAAHLLRHQMYGNTNYIVAYYTFAHLSQDEERKCFVIGTIFIVSIPVAATASSPFSTTTLS